MIRDDVGPDMIMDRIAMQMDQKEKCLKADFVIDNSGNVDLIPQIEMMLEKAKSVR